MSLTTKKRTLAQAPTPEAGEVTLYVDIADGLLKAKLPDGTGAAVTGGGGDDAALTPVACALLNGVSEAVTAQVGDVITGIAVVETGEYEITLDPSAGLSDPFRLAVQVTCYGADRFASYLANLPEDKISVYVRNAAGTGVSAAYMSVTLWYLPETEEIP